MSENVRKRLGQIVPPILALVVFLLLWEWFVVARNIKPFLLPKPSAIWEQIRLQKHGIWQVTQNSAMNALVGLVLGTVIGVAAASVASRFRTVNEMITPLAAAVSAVPIIALTPMFNNLFSSTSAIPRRLVVTIIVFFPIFVNVVKGLTQVEPTHAELMRSYAASPGEFLRKVRIPNALPFLFTGLKLAASLCVISAVVAEYFGGLKNGIGNRITDATAVGAYPRAWAYVFAACLLGLAFFVASLVLERIAMPWRAKRLARG